ncbi:MAG: uracil-DNA glycosylase [Chitinophagaceae bacterium]|nr:uracil-DNA glycosylase [Chitinophagaceae bacterium]
MIVTIEDSWKKELNDEFQKKYFIELTQFIKEEYKKYTIYPPGKEIFNAFNSCPLYKVKVVIVGQDPYHGEKQAHGLSFSVNDNIPIPPSLQNIFKEIETDIGNKPPIHGNLQRWANQGVFLLNTVLTVKKNHPCSHQNKGWETFTHKVLQIVSEKKTHIVFLLWGNFAKQKKNLIDNTKHLILEASHPSPFSSTKGFFGCKHFSKTNEYLISKKITPINW